MDETLQNIEKIQKISKFRRFLPQIFGSCAKNLMILSMGEFALFPAIVIPSLIGMNRDLNPDETLSITAAQSSYLASFAHIAHPVGSLLSGPICDKIGRRKTIMLVTLPLMVSWIMLGFAHSFPVICFGFALIGFSFGLKEAPSVTYVSEISEPALRGTLLSIASITLNLGIFVVLGLGSLISWRQVSLICAVAPLCCLIAVFAVPESPYWLLSKDRPKEAQKSLQWLRGWVNSLTVHVEFTQLQNFSNSSNSCSECEKQSIKCYHPQPSFLDRIKDLKRRRNLRPAVLLFCLQFFNEFGVMTVWQSYAIQVFNALGAPINPNLATVLSSVIGILASIFLISSVKKLGRRTIYLTSTFVVFLCCFALSFYGFCLLGSNWASFKNPDDPLPNVDRIREMVGNYSYLALVLILVMQFGTKIGLAGMPFMYLGEIFPFKARSLLCGIATANQYILASIATKTYYNVEMWLSLPGAILFYGVISLIGFIVMWFIMPELEGRSLEGIEIHFSDSKKGFTDISIPKCRQAVEK